MYSNTEMCCMQTAVWLDFFFFLSQRKTNLWEKIWRSFLCLLYVYNWVSLGWCGVFTCVVLSSHMQNLNAILPEKRRSLITFYILLSVFFIFLCLFLRMQLSKLRPQPHKPSLLLKMLLHPTRTLLLTSSWCRAARWGSMLTDSRLPFIVWCPFFGLVCSIFPLFNESLKMFISHSFLSCPHWALFHLFFNGTCVV